MCWGVALEGVARVRVALSLALDSRSTTRRQATRGKGGELGVTFHRKPPAVAFLSDPPVTCRPEEVTAGG